MSEMKTIAEQGTDITSQIKSSQISIIGFKGETLNLDEKKVVDTVFQTQSIVKKVIGMNNEAITMDGVPLVNSIH